VVREPIITHQSRGIFDAREWFEEGDGLLASARLTFATWIRRGRVLSKRLDEERPVGRLWAEYRGLPRAATLLLGYAAEMFLKKALVRAYDGCPEGLFAHDVQRKFAHKLAQIAAEVDFPFKPGDQALFDRLQNGVMEEARYPLRPQQRSDYFMAKSVRDALFHSRQNFQELRELVGRTRDHAILVDQDENNPMSSRRWNIDADGYLVFRYGGNLRPRVTWRPSSDQVARNAALLDDMRKLVGSYFLLEALWDQCVFVEDKGKRL
jgi:hypothetical protein